jgi:sugar phosphate isomerase/epimerase
MRVSVSNIAWERADDPAIADLLVHHGIYAIDVAPGKYFDVWTDPERASVEAVREAWRARGIEIVGLQALLFGTTGLNLFGPPEVQKRMLAHLGRVCRIGSWLGATRLTFGSPGNRDRTGMEDEEARRVAVDFFRRLGDVAADNGVTVCLEPNPPRYRCNFMTTTADAANVVREVDHPAIRLQLDTGAMTICDEVPLAVIQQCGTWIGHVHASEPDLLPLGLGGTDHPAVAAALLEHLPGMTVAVEMLRPKNQEGIAWMDSAMKIAKTNYAAQKDSQSA